MEFIQILSEQLDKIEMLSSMATSIVREHFDPLIGKEQNDYMISMFQSVSSIKQQLAHGYQYYFVLQDGKPIGFLAIVPKQDTMYLSKFYLYKEERQKGYAREMLTFVVQKTRLYHLPSIELNVNRNNSAIYAYEKLGFIKIREEKNDIGNGFYMDDFVYRYTL